MPLTTIFAASAAITCTGNILTNPGFENDLAGWTILYPSAVSVSTDVVHSGSKALLFTVGTGTSTNPLSGTMALQTFSPPRPGPITALSFWCRVDPSLNANYTLDISTGGGGGPGGFATATGLVPGQWTFVDVHQLVAPTFTELRLYFNSISQTTGTRVYIDDVVMVPGPGGAGAVGAAAAVMAMGGKRRRR